jgi:DNA-binding transcriptional LysR family regulator
MLDHLKLYRDIAEARSVSRGAAANGVTQSAASQHLRELERRYGAAFLDRSTRPLTVTPAGQAYYEMCRDILRRHEEMTAALDQLRGGGTVRVAAIYSAGLSDMERVQAEFTRRFPKAHLKVEYLRPEKVYEAVRDGSADLGLVSYPQPSRDLLVTRWRNERMVVAVAPAHRLARKRKIHPSDLNGVDFVSFDEDLPIRRHIDSFLASHGVTVGVTMHFDNIPAVKEAVALGHASILPERMMQAEVDAGLLVAVPLTVKLARPLGIVRRKRGALPPAAAEVIGMLRYTGKP